MIEIIRYLVDVRPKGIGHLEIICLMARNIQECEVTGIVLIGFKCINPHGFTALTVKIAPIRVRAFVFDDKRV